MNRRTLGISALGIVAAGLALSVPAAALADNPHGHQQLHGTVTAPPSGNTLQVAVKHGDTTTNVTVTVPSDARIFVPGAHASAHGRQPRLGAANLSSIGKDFEVVAQGQYSADGKSFTATRLHVVPAHLTVHATGKASVSGTNITVAKSDGTSVTFTTDGSTKIRPQGKTITDVGTNNPTVTVVGRRQANGTILATGVVIQA